MGGELHTWGTNGSSGLRLGSVGGPESKRFSARMYRAKKVQFTSHLPERKKLFGNPKEAKPQKFHLHRGGLWVVIDGDLSLGPTSSFLLPAVPPAKMRDCHLGGGGAEISFEELFTGFKTWEQGSL